MSDNVWEEIGTLKGRLTSLESVVGDNRLTFLTRLDSIDTKLDAIIAKDAHQIGMVKGGWFVVTLLAAILVSAGALIYDWLHKLMGY